MTPTAFENPIFCALDTPDLSHALELAREIAPHVGGLKLGLEFFMANGPGGVRAVQEKTGLPIFLDVKLHDIPNTVAGAVRALAPLGLSVLTIHASGGPAMMKAAREAANEAADIAGVKRPRLLGVTVLTSLDTRDLTDVGIIDSPNNQVLRLANLAREFGMDGIVCSSMELEMIRGRYAKPFMVAVPGLRPGGQISDDQKRVRAPEDAAEAGADILVIGRPITANSAPADAAARIWEIVRARLSAMNGGK